MTSRGDVMRVRELRTLLRVASDDAVVWVAVFDADGDEESQLPVTEAWLTGDRLMLGAGRRAEGRD